jgi:hypothetical protein
MLMNILEREGLKWIFVELQKPTKRKDIPQYEQNISYSSDTCRTN